ncbi:hypothetical protein [uncultured Ruegeria sp.]|uniref:hypothetical protein n=1 Tax=uncultured Ruegeria sp. TaxID=259304 RepID=UPI0026345102|nr:hypothetical protein [uncultured Ruegeria sp.]
MKPHYLIGLSIAALAVPGVVLAQSAADANGDGVLTIEEVQSVVPEVDADTFSVMDANGDGALDADEIAIAQEAGLLPPSNG